VGVLFSLETISFDVTPNNASLSSSKGNLAFQKRKTLVKLLKAKP
jgi:hypothetical protein